MGHGGHGGGGGLGGGGFSASPPMNSGDEELAALLESLDPAILEQLMSMGALEGEQGMAAMQMKRGEALRGTPMPEGRQAGRTFVAANPLEMVGAAGMRMKGDREAEAGMKASHDILGKQTAGRMAFAQMLANATRRPKPLDPLAMTRSDEFELG